MRSITFDFNHYINFYSYADKMYVIPYSMTAIKVSKPPVCVMNYPRTLSGDLYEQVADVVKEKINYQYYVTTKDEYLIAVYINNAFMRNKHPYRTRSHIPLDLLRASNNLHITKNQNDYTITYIHSLISAQAERFGRSYKDEYKIIRKLLKLI